MKLFFISATAFAILALRSTSQGAPSDLIGKTLKPNSIVCLNHAFKTLGDNIFEGAPLLLALDLIILSATN